MMRRVTLCKDPTVTCNYGTLSTNYFLEIGAIVLVIIGLSVHSGKAHKSSTQKKIIYSYFYIFNYIKYLFGY